jgi:hypothetical protein
MLIDLNADFNFEQISLADNLIITLFFWAFAALFSLFYLLFAVIIARQTNILNKSVSSKSAPLIYFISSMQIPVAAALLVFAIASLVMVIY